MGPNTPTYIYPEKTTVSYTRPLSFPFPTLPGMSLRAIASNLQRACNWSHWEWREALSNGSGALPLKGLAEYLYSTQPSSPLPNLCPGEGDTHLHGFRHLVKQPRRSEAKAPWSL